MGLINKINLFPIILPADATLTYRIWTITPIPATDELKQKIRTYLWKKGLRRPISLSYWQGQFVYLVADWGNQEMVEYVGEGERKYSIAPTETTCTMTISRLQTDEIELAAAMIQQQFTSSLQRNPKLARGNQNNAYYDVNPEIPNNNNRQQRSDVDIFRGFSLRVIYVYDVGFCLALDVQTSYVGRNTLATYLKKGWDYRDLEVEKGLTRWVNDYGRLKQSVYLLHPMNMSIGEVMQRNDRTTYDDLVTKYPHLKNRITPTDEAATIIYKVEDQRNETKHYTAATTLLKPKFTNKHRSVKALKDKAAFPPSERLRRIQKVLSFCENIPFDDKTTISLGSVLEVQDTILPLPPLVFGSGDAPIVLRPQIRRGTELQDRKHWIEQKFEWLFANGPHRKAEFTNAYFVYPASLEDGNLLEDFLGITSEFCKNYGGVEFNPELSSYRDNAHPREIIEKLKGLAENRNAGFILLALPEAMSAADQVYVGAKTQIRIPTKCFSTPKLRQKMKQGEMKTYTELNALALLVENGTRPWGIAEPLHYPLQFGFDVKRTKHSSLMGATTVSNPTASNIAFHYEEFDGRSESIPPKFIGGYILKCLVEFVETYGHSPAKILIQRDGRVYDKELNAIRKALHKFAEQYPNLDLPNWTAVSIEKTMGASIRLLRQDGNRTERPYSGTFFLQDDSVGYLVTAGDPSAQQGTPKPLKIEVVGHSVDHQPDIMQPLQDIFWLSQLNWNSPSKDISLPITLRFADQKLGRYALRLEQPTKDDDWDDFDS